MLADLDDLTVSQFLAARAAKLSPYSVERERCGLLALWRLAADRRLVDTRPCVQAELLPERTPRAFTLDELRRLYAAASAMPGNVGTVPAGIFWAALTIALFETGERVAAMIRAPRAGWTAPFLRVPAEIRKGRRRERIYELSADASRLVAGAAQHQAENLFHWPSHIGTLYNRWSAITERAGIAGGREIRFHALRRSCASHLTAGAGIAAAVEQLGHGSETITRRSYIDPRIASAGRVRPLDVLPRIASPKPEPAP